MATQPVALEPSGQKAAEELIAVTGEKGIDRQWDLADALLKASPTVDSYDMEQVRQAAVDKAGHDEFWSVSRLRQMARTAQAWPAKDRVAGVALDAHLEAARGTADLAAAKKVIASAGQTSKKKGAPSIREIRKELGVNGTAAQPPRVDKADVDELWHRLVPMKADLKSFLRKNLKVESMRIRALLTLLTEMDGLIAQLNSGQQSPASPAAQKPKTTKPQVPTATKGRVKGI